MSAFGKSVIYNEDGVVSTAQRKLGDEVGSNAFPWGGRNRNGDEFSFWFFREGFGSSTEVASFDIVSDESSHVGPPVIAGNQLVSFPAARVSSDRGVMMELKDFPSEVFVVRDVDLSSKEDESLFLRPFFRAKVFGG